jgi:hypothetical protein
VDDVRHAEQLQRGVHALLAVGVDRSHAPAEEQLQRRVHAGVDRNAGVAGVDRLRHPQRAADVGALRVLEDELLVLRRELLEEHVRALAHRAVARRARRERHGAEHRVRDPHGDGVWRELGEQGIDVVLDLHRPSLADPTASRSRITSTSGL